MYQTSFIHVDENVLHRTDVKFWLHISFSIQQQITLQACKEHAKLTKSAYVAWLQCNGCFIYSACAKLKPKCNYVALHENGIVESIISIMVSIIHSNHIQMHTPFAVDPH